MWSPFFTPQKVLGHKGAWAGFALKRRTSVLDTVSTGSDSDLVNDGVQKSFGISHANY